MDKRKQIPKTVNNPLHKQLFSLSLRANMTEQEIREYTQHMKQSLDYYNTIAYAKQEGIEEGERVGIEKGERVGREEGERVGREKGEQSNKIATARNMLAEKCSIDLIHRVTGLSVDEIKALG